MPGIFFFCIIAGICLIVIVRSSKQTSRRQCLREVGDVFSILRDSDGARVAHFTILPSCEMEAFVRYGPDIDFRVGVEGASAEDRAHGVGNRRHGNGVHRARFKDGGENHVGIDHQGARIVGVAVVPADELCMFERNGLDFDDGTSGILPLAVHGAHAGVTGDHLD